jgi:hypothetical protein
MTGSSITEGGVNIAFGIKPSGRFVASVSDEHNFLENIGFGIGKAIESSLPNRVIMMTTPVTGKIKNFKPKLTSGSGSKVTQYEKNRLAMMKELDNRAWKESLTNITTAKATRPDMLHEVGRQYQGLGVGSAGLFSGSYSQ